jgi:hypothetical protein
MRHDGCGGRPAKAELLTGRRGGVLPTGAAERLNSGIGAARRGSVWPRSPITLETRLQAEKTAQLLTALGFGLAGRRGSVAAFRVGLKLVGSLERIW